MTKPVTKNVQTLRRLKIEYVPINSIKPNDYNPNRQSDTEFELLCRSIEEDGFTQPILVQQDSLEIVDGEHRWRACTVLGFDEVPIVLVPFTKEQMMISTLRHNRARGNEDINIAADVIKDLRDIGALDWAKDSLLLDDVEVQIMLDDIPEAELILRTPGEKLTVDEVETLIQHEKQFRESKKEEEALMAREDRKPVALQLSVLKHEMWIIEVAIASYGVDRVLGLVALCQEFENE